MGTDEEAGWKITERASGVSTVGAWAVWMWLLNIGNCRTLLPLK